MKEYLIYIGTIEPRKNIVGMLEAFDLVLEDFPYLKLVIAGKPGWKCEKILEEIKKRPAVEWLGYVSEEEKWRLLGGSRGLIYTSFYEGFGLPVLEAFAAGVPVITSNSSSLIELAGEAAITVDPKDIKGLADYIVRLLSDDDLSASLKQKGRARAAEFEWSKAAEKTAALYQRVLSTNRSELQNF